MLRGKYGLYEFGKDDSIWTNEWMVGDKVLDMNILNMDFYRQMCTFITLDG